MIKRLMVVLAMVALFASVANAQWSDFGAFPDTSVTGSTHGIVVDPDGKIWTAPYYYETTWIDGEDTLLTAGIRVFEPSGEEVSFSPINLVATGGGFVVDTLFPGRCRGLAADENGNIVYVASGPSKMYKINYLTGEGMGAVEIPETGSSPTGPGISDDGTIFVGPVVGNGGADKQIAMYDTDLNYLGAAVVGPPAISRCLEVSDDGNTIYWTPFTAFQMYIYNRPDEFSEFALVDSALAGMSIETARLNPETGVLWVSNDARGEAYTSMTWFGFDPTTKTLVDSFHYVGKDPSSADYFARGLDFSTDGQMAYVGTFSALQYVITRFGKGALPTIPITFEADMSVQVDKGNFDASTGAVTLAGTMNGWDAAANPMLDGDGDLVYSVTLDLNEGDVHNFKFVMNGDGWETIPDREYTVAGSADTYNAYFDNDDGRELSTIAVSFQCNMELEIAAARFDPSTDTLSARGSFNGWSDVTMLSPSVTDPNIYEGSADYETFDGDEIYYKFAYTTATGVNWETNPPTDSDNYEHAVTATDISNSYTLVPLRGFNNATLETVVNQESVIRFVVDMNGAVDANGVAFPSLDNVAIAGANPPLGWPGGGWPDDDPNVIYLVDDGTNGDDVAGDKIFSKSITFPIYSPLTIQYKYGANWGLASNNGINDNEAGVGSDHFLHLFPGFWNGDAVDVFGVMGDQDIVNGIEQIGSELPSSYELGQNYPNPFNPSTMINFSIPESGLVTLKVFNVLGQEIAELVNDVKSAGNYEVSFDASNLTTGMYIYKIQTGNYSATKKMMLVK